MGRSRKRRVLDRNGSPVTRDARDIALPFDVNIFQAGPHAINRTGRLFGSRAKQSRMAPDARKPMSPLEKAFRANAAMYLAQARLPVRA